MTTQQLVPVRRPNGKMYRPRLGPRAAMVEHTEWDDVVWVYVLGTHDHERARELAQRVGDVESDPEPPTWVRLAARDGEQRYIVDEERGVPCLIFRMA